MVNRKAEILFEHGVMKQGGALHYYLEKAKYKGRIPDGNWPVPE